MADHFYVYPAYLSAEVPRSLGRRVPAPTGLGPVTLDEIVAAAQKLGYTAEAEPEKHYPRRFHRYEGRVKVMKRRGTSKTAFLRALAGALAPTHPAHPTHRKG